MSLPTDPTPSVCIVGAGPSGLAAARRLLEAGVRDIVVYERQASVGGNWTWNDPVGHSSIYETVRSISSRDRTAFHGAPFSPTVQLYPTRSELLHYLRAFATRFDLLRHIQFNTTVLAITPAPQGGWLVEAVGQPPRRFDVVCICNGHHWDPVYPDLPGTFAGPLIHAHDYKDAARFEGQRALVIGCGNSGADIAVDLSRHHGRVTLSLRRGYHIVPRMIFGLPSDVLYARLRDWLPHFLLRPLAQLFLQLHNGLHCSTGLPAPDHVLFATHPLINSELLPAIRGREIQIAGAIRSVHGYTVTFASGESRDFDVILACTGYRPAFPFLAPHLVGDSTEALLQNLHLRFIHKQHMGLFFLGLLQPSGSIWPVADAQSRLLAAHLTGTTTLPTQEITNRAYAPNYVSSPRHLLEVDGDLYERALLGWLKKHRSAAHQPTAQGVA